MIGKTIKTNDIKKGDRVRLRNGWWAKIEDNMKGTIRLATVYGFETEMGSIYSHNILYAEKDAIIRYVELTPKQVEIMELERTTF